MRVLLFGCLNPDADTVHGTFWIPITQQTMRRQVSGKRPVITGYDKPCQVAARPLRNAQHEDHLSHRQNVRDRTGKGSST
ncbi:MAG: hypothetical protein OXE94_08255 [Aestuariivita sp.]|nr:hypothetical protein [Aestuariivita sp.]MCY4202513.1 hypothetical protein [Aestuariivita sp.]MCY4287334.1 hypothetical protein [Aestuariivita sp.]MCY4346012.1 hypothetical protein [Aestuariivita sp.]